MRARHPEAAVVGYVNSTADSKAEMDICCTSANAEGVVGSLDEEEVIFVPDANLGAYVQTLLPEKRILLWEGYCPTHQAITPAMIAALKEAHPEAEVLMHPECRPEALAMADFVGSTAGILARAKESPAQEFIVGTETGMLHRLNQDVPGKTFIGVDCAVCPPMKMCNPESILRSLRDDVGRLDLEGPQLEPARKALERMLDLRD